MLNSKQKTSKKKTKKPFNSLLPNITAQIVVKVIKAKKNHSRESRYVRKDRDREREGGEREWSNQ